MASDTSQPSSSVEATPTRSPMIERIERRPPPAWFSLALLITSCAALLWLAAFVRGAR